MPTPFTHLACAQRLLMDGTLSAEQRALLQSELPAFVLGSIAADGHGGGGLRREDTHFYTYERPISTPLPDALLTRYPALACPSTEHQRAFVAGYLGHLAVDEVWTEGLMRPYFIDASWGSGGERFLMLNVLLIGMDERDRATLDPALGEALLQADPHNWLSFLPDEALRSWRDLITRQLATGGESETLLIISQRTGRPIDELRTLVDSPALLNDRLWAYVPPAALAETEARMETYAVEQVARYLGG